MAAMYTMITLVVGEDTAPSNDSERLFCFVILLLGSVLFACLLGNVTVLVSNLDMGYSAFRDRMHALANNMKYVVATVSLSFCASLAAIPTSALFLGMEVSDY